MSYPKPFASEGFWGVEHGRAGHRKVAWVGSQYWAEEVMFFRFWWIRPVLVQKPVLVPKVDRGM